MIIHLLSKYLYTSSKELILLLYYVFPDILFSRQYPIYFVSNVFDIAEDNAFIIILSIF